MLYRFTPIAPVSASPPKRCAPKRHAYIIALLHYSICMNVCVYTYGVLFQLTSGAKLVTLSMYVIDRSKLDLDLVPILFLRAVVPLQNGSLIVLFCVKLPPHLCDVQQYLIENSFQTCMPCTFFTDV